MLRVAHRHVAENVVPIRTDRMDRPTTPHLIHKIITKRCGEGVPAARSSAMCRKNCLNRISLFRSTFAFNVPCSYCTSPDQRDGGEEEEEVKVRGDSANRRYHFFIA